jgi:hypothetical protein
MNLHGKYIVFQQAEHIEGLKIQICRHELRAIGQLLSVSNIATELRTKLL